MEFSLVSQGTVPDDAVVSVRAGTLRRQAAVSTGRSFRFPKSACKENPIKVDILKQIGTAYLVLKPGEDQYNETDVEALRNQAASSLLRAAEDGILEKALAKAKTHTITRSPANAPEDSEKTDRADTAKLVVAVETEEPSLPAPTSPLGALKIDHVNEAGNVVVTQEAWDAALEVLKSQSVAKSAPKVYKDSVWLPSSIELASAACPNCGMEVFSDAAFCRHCGFKLPWNVACPRAEEDTAQQPSPTLADLAEKPAAPAVDVPTESN